MKRGMSSLPRVVGSLSNRITSRKAIAEMEGEEKNQLVRAHEASYRSGREANYQVARRRRK